MQLNTSAKPSLKKNNTNLGLSTNISKNSISWRPRQWPTLFIKNLEKFSFKLSPAGTYSIVRSKGLNCVVLPGDPSAAWVRGLPDEQPDCPCSPPPQNTQCLRWFQVSIVRPEQCCGAGFNGVPESGSGSKRAKMAQKNRKQFKNFIFCWMFFFEG
jgi:hypothetical protein